MKKLIFIYLCTFSIVCLGQANYTHYSRVELEQDLDFISEKVTNIHPLLLNKAAYENWQNTLSETRASLKDSLTQNEFYIVAATLLTTLNDGHSGIVMPFDQRIEYTKAGGAGFPFFVDISDYTMVNDFYCGNDSLLFRGGEELLQINRINSADMVREMQKIFGGKSLAIKQKGVATNFRFFIWMFYGFENDYEIVFKNKLNEVQTVVVPGVSSHDFRQNIKRRPQANNEWFTFSIDTLQRTAQMKIKSFGDLKGFCSFADSAFSEIELSKVENLVIDVRGNGGGRSIVVDSLMNYLTDRKYTQYKKIETRVSKELKERYEEKYPERVEWINKYEMNELATQEQNSKQPVNNKLRFKGDLYLLTNNTSFSAAATFAGVFKQLQLGVIIGEETGGTIEYFGDYWMIKTPNTAINLYVAPKRFIQHGGNELNRGVVPDYVVEDNNDSILDFTFELIQQRNATGGEDR